MSKRINGVIKWYSEKHFGFLVTAEDNKEVFFHINDCNSFTPQEGAPVEFEMGLDRKGRSKAINIKSVCVGVHHEHSNR